MPSSPAIDSWLGVLLPLQLPKLIIVSRFGGRIGSHLPQHCYGKISSAYYTLPFPYSGLSPTARYSSQ